LNLVEKSPKDDIQREDALAAVMTGGFWGEQGDRNIAAEKLAKLGQRITLAELFQCFFEGRNRRISEEQRAEALKKRGC